MFQRRINTFVGAVNNKRQIVIWIIKLQTDGTYVKQTLFRFLSIIGLFTVIFYSTISRSGTKFKGFC